MDLLDVPSRTGPVYIPPHTPVGVCVTGVGWGSFQDKYLRAGLVKHTLFTLSLGNRGGGPKLMDPLLGDDGDLLSRRGHKHIIAFFRPCYQAS